MDARFPALRIITMAEVLFTGMFLSRVFVIGPLGFAIGFVMAAAQSFVDGAPNAETAVRALLWLWVIVYIRSRSPWS
jgi:multidrug resistance protein MdtO